MVCVNGSYVLNYTKIEVFKVFLEVVAYFLSDHDAVLGPWPLTFWLLNWITSYRCHSRP